MTTSETHSKGVQGDAEADKHRAKLIIRPEVSAAIVIESYAVGGKQDLAALITELEHAIAPLGNNDLTQAENMLMSQATALQSMFVCLSRRAMQQESMSNLETFLRMALKAQNQCRMTLESLATLKNPPVIYARQANITSGPQQVNNGVAPTTHAHAYAHAEKTEKPQNELLEQKPHERLDTRTKSKASRIDPAMAPMAEIDRPKKQRGKK